MISKEGKQLKMDWFKTNLTALVTIASLVVGLIAYAVRVEVNTTHLQKEVTYLKQRLENFDDIKERIATLEANSTVQTKLLYDVYDIVVKERNN